MDSRTLQPVGDPMPRRIRTLMRKAKLLPAKQADAIAITEYQTDDSYVEELIAKTNLVDCVM